MFECTAIHEHFTRKAHGPKNPPPTTSIEVAAYNDALARNDAKVVDGYCRIRFDACADGADGALPVGKRGHIEIEYPLRKESLPFKVGEFFGITFSKTAAPEHVVAGRKRQAEEAAAAQATAGAAAGPGDQDEDDDEDDE